MLAELRTPDYYCHICACEIVSQVNAVTRDVECSQCSNNFVELLGQGVESFVSGDADDVTPPCRQTGADVQPGEADRRSSDPIRQSLRNREALRGRDPAGHDLISRDSQQVLTSNNGPAGIIVSSTVNIGNNHNTSGPRSVMPSQYIRAAELEGLMNAFIVVRTVPGDGSLSGNIGGTGRTFDDLLHHIFMNEISHSGEPPATAKIIESLNRSVVTVETDLVELGNCSISQEAFELGDTAVHLPCNHSYKEDPITHWLKMHNTCPVCRIPLTIGEQGVTVP